jgi:ABC-type polysaccharide/polyol phosphate export permease
VTTTLAEYRSHSELLAHLTLRELRGKYKRSFLGWAWSMINPLVYMVVYTVVFSRVLRANPNPGYHHLHVFALWLLCAMLPYIYLQTVVMGCVTSLVSNANLIKKAYFPRELLPASTVIGGLVDFGIAMGLLVVALVAWGDWPALEFLPFTVVLMGAMAVFALGLGLALSVLNVFFRDIEHFMGIIFLVWMFLTPIMYPPTLHSLQRYQFILKLNPMTDAAESFRAVLYNGTHPGWIEFGGFLVVAVITLLIGRAIFNHFEPRVAEEL